MANEVTITVRGRDQGGRKALDDVGSSVRRVGEIAQGIIAAQLFQQIGQAAQQFMGNAKVAATNLGESVNAVGVVFKGTSADILEVGKTASTSMGLSQRAFNDASVRFSNFAKTVAGPGGDVVKVITDITQRSSDFASVMNLDVNEAMQVFQSGLAGESEPLRRYGIDVSAAAVQTFAYAEGIAEAGTELTEAQKVQARYGLIMQQTNEMAGDFANTSDSLANQQRILNAEWENAQATMGQAVVPAFQALNAALIPVLQAFSDLPGPAQTVISVLVLLGAGILTVTSRIAPMIIAMNAAGISMSSLTAKARTLTASLGPIGLVFAALAFAVIKGVQEFQAADVEVDKLTEDLERLAKTGRETGVVSELMSRDLEHFGSTLEAVAADAQSNWADRNFIWSPSKRKEVNQAVEDIGALNESLAAIVQSGGDGEAALLAYADANGLTAEEVEKLRSFLPDYAEAQTRANEATQDGTEAAEEAAKAAAEYADKVREMADAWGEAVGEMVDLNQAWEDSNQETTGSFLEQLEEQINAQRNHADNIVKLRQRASDDIEEILLEEVKDHPDLAAQLVGATDEEWAKLEGLLRKDVRNANRAANDELIANIPALTEIAETAGQNAARGLADKIRNGGKLTVGEVNRIMNQAKNVVEGKELVAVIDSRLNERSRAAAERRLAFLARSRTVRMNVDIVQRRGVNASQFSAHGGIVGGLATGGISGAQRGMQTGGVSGVADVLVGENGPEIAQLPFGTRVIPSGQSMAMVRAAEATAPVRPETHVTFGDVHVSISVKDLKELQDVAEFFDMLQSTARQFGARG